MTIEEDAQVKYWHVCEPAQYGEVYEPLIVKVLCMYLSVDDLLFQDSL